MAQRYKKDVHIGSIIKRILSERGISYAELARQLHCDRTTIYGIVRSKSIDVDRLIRISQILNYDFIQNEYVHRERTDPTNDKMERLRQQLLDCLTTLSER